MSLQLRAYLPRDQCHAFVPASDSHQSGIGSIFVINLQRRPDRLTGVLGGLKRILDATGRPLSDRAVRYSACDAQIDPEPLMDHEDIHPYYTLGDQLFVEPQPNALPDAFDLERPIRMSPAECAVAHSHINVWKAIAQSTSPYTLVLEDDVWFERGFGRIVDEAWSEMETSDRARPGFDVLYVSYKEARYGAPKELLSKNVFRPERGLWFLSGYVLSKKGAQALLRNLPCCGPIDLWINHKFRHLDVRALRRSVVQQRSDTPSTNSYSILPSLSRIGVLDYSDTALFHQRPTHSPVFGFVAADAASSSLGMALSMLGYRCCSDLDRIPKCEFDRLLSGRAPRIFDAYINIASLRPHLRQLLRRYPRAKFIVIGEVKGTSNRYSCEALDDLRGADLIRLNGGDANTWRALCEHVRLPPPAAPFPAVAYIGQRKLRATLDAPMACPAKQLRHDRSPWVAEPHLQWTGISASVSEGGESTASRIRFYDDLADFDLARWQVRNDTFPGNLGLFRPNNITAQARGGLMLRVIQEPLGVRNLSAAAISTRGRFLYGRFEAMLQATSVSGLVTGFFLHRNSPRQEIDIEITGNDPTRLLVNVFYNPGAEDAKFDYGYRGTPVAIPLGFDASKAFHKFAIEWDPCELRWFVDGRLIHRRAEWNPTPIPHLPMMLHVNTWPTRSRELAGRLSLRALPASAVVRSIAVNALDGALEHPGRNSTRRREEHLSFLHQATRAE